MILIIKDKNCQAQKIGNQYSSLKKQQSKTKIQDFEMNRRENVCGPTQIFEDKKEIYICDK